MCAEHKQVPLELNIGETKLLTHAEEQYDPFYYISLLKIIAGNGGPK